MDMIMMMSINMPTSNLFLFFDSINPGLIPVSSKMTSLLNQAARVCKLALAGVLFQAGSVAASDQIPGAPQSGPIAIVGATIHLIEGRPIENGTIVFENGKITKVGKTVALPKRVEEISAVGKHVYPSLIDAYSDIGLVEVNSVRATIDSRETGNINPNVRAVAAFNPDSELIPVNRANGILLALCAPQGGLVSGRSSLMMLDGWTWEDMTLQADVGMHVNWPQNGEADELEKLFDQVARYVAGRAEENLRLPLDLRLESLSKVLDGSLPMIANANSAAQIESAVAFSVQQKIRLIIRGGHEAETCAALLKQYDIPVILSGVYRLPSHRDRPYDEAYTLPHRLKEAGVRFCISADGRFGASGLRNLPYHAATAAAFGLSESDALRAITLSPAEILGVADRVGAIAKNRDATLFITDGNILETETQVEMAFVQGRKVDLDNRHQQLYRKYQAKYDRP